MAATKKTVAETKAVKETEVKAEAAKVEKKAPAKKAAAKKAPAKKAAAKKENVVVQFAGKEFDVDAVVEAAKADYKANNKGAVRSLNVYIKPEDNAAYYVVNSKAEGKIEL